MGTVRGGRLSMPTWTPSGKLEGYPDRAGAHGVCKIKITNEPYNGTSVILEHHEKLKLAAKARAKKKATMMLNTPPLKQAPRKPAEPVVPKPSTAQREYEAQAIAKAHADLQKVMRPVVGPRPPTPLADQ